MQNQGENENGGEDSTRGREGDGAKHVVEENLDAIFEVLRAGSPTLRTEILSSSDFDANGEVRWGKVFRDAREQDRQFAKTLQFFAARTAAFQMLADGNALLHAGGAGEGVIQITGEPRVNGVAGHWGAH